MISSFGYYSNYQDEVKAALGTISKSIIARAIALKISEEKNADDIGWEWFNELKIKIVHLT